MRSSACESGGSAQTAFSTLVAALAQSKLAASAPHTGTARQAARRMTVRTARGWRVRRGAANDSIGMAERMCRLPTPSKPALLIRRGYELIASKPQSTFCCRLLQRHGQTVGRGRHRCAGTGADRDQVFAIAWNGADPGLGVVVRSGSRQRLAGDQRAAIGGAGDAGALTLDP